MLVPDGCVLVPDAPCSDRLLGVVPGAAAAALRFAGTPLDASRDAGGRLAGGWHWNMPYSVKRELPDWYKKEVSRYTGAPQ